MRSASRLPIGEGLVAARNQLPDKLFFKIGEVADIVGVKPHVLRYWEAEFHALRPKKTRGAHRMYARRDVELAVLIRRLLHDEGFTVPGARKRLRELGHDLVSSVPEPKAAREVALRAELLALRSELSALLGSLEAIAKAPEPPTSSVTVQSSSPNAVAVVQPARRS